MDDSSLPGPGCAPGMGHSLGETGQGCALPGLPGELGKRPSALGQLSPMRGANDWLGGSLAQEGAQERRVGLASGADGPWPQGCILLVEGHLMLSTCISLVLSFLDSPR